MKSVQNSFVLGLVLALLAGCASLPNSNERKGEKVKLTLKLTDPSRGGAKSITLPLIGAVTSEMIGKWAARLGAEVLEREGKKYKASYEAKEFLESAVTEFPGGGAPALSMDAILKRSVDSGDAVELVLDYVPYRSLDDSKGFFQIVPRKLVVQKTKAKIPSASFGGKRKDVKMTFVVTTTIPSENGKEGVVNYLYTFSVNGIVPGEASVDLSSKGIMPSNYFPVPAVRGTPIAVKVQVLEYNKMGDWFSKASKQLKDLAD